MSVTRNQLVRRLTVFLPLAALIVLAIYPVLSGGLPTTGDGLNHFYRVAELEWHIQHGDWYPRWFVNMGYGFGMPVLNFYSPLTYYIPLLFRLIGVSLATALQWSYVLALAVAMLGAYAWWREQFESEVAGLITSGAYGLAPYFYFNMFHRGAYPETWALALMPWLLWVLERVVTRSATKGAHIALVALSAALVLTHTLSALIFAPVGVVYGLGLLLAKAQPKDEAWRCLGRLAVDGVLALAVAAFFVLPLALESSDIQLQRTYSTGDLDYHNNFLTPNTLLAAPPNFDPHLVFNTMPPSLGWPQAALALGAVLAAGVDYAERRRLDAKVLLLAVCGFGLAALTLGASEPLWNALPWVRFIQFPWRLVGPASLFMAGLSGAAIQRITNYVLRIAPRNSWLIAGISGLALVTFFFFSLSWTYHSNFAPPSYNSPADTVNYEVTSGELGTTSTAEYLPKGVEALPDPQTLAGPLATNGLVTRLQPLPSTVKSSVSKTEVNAEVLSYESPTPLPVTYNLFYFPGWAATVDGQAIEVQAVPRTGLITLSAPAGAHTLRLFRQLTSPELAGTIISLIGLLGVVVWAFWGKFVPHIEQQSPTPITSYGLGLSVTLVVISVALLLVRAFYFDRVETAFHHTNPIPNPISVNFGDQLELVGFEYGNTLTSGGELPVMLYWRASQPLTNDYSVSVQLADRLGNRFGQADSQHPNGVPTSRWALDQYARDVHSLESLKGTPPGTYELLVTVYSKQGPLSILQDNAPIGIDDDLGSVTVGPAMAEPSGPLTLTEHELATESVMVGDELRFTALWFSGDGPLSDLMASVELTDDAGKTIFQQTLPPAGPDYPMTQWAHDTYVRYPFSLTLPPDLPTGVADVRLALTDAKGAVAAGPFELGHITISVPPRSFDIPPMQVRVDHDYGKTIRLLGYDVQADSIILYWQSLKTISQRLTVFVHTLNENNAFVNGNDAPPARPTTGWLPGEVIVDQHPIAVGGHFEVGLYDPRTGERFGETFVTSP